MPPNMTHAELEPTAREIARGDFDCELCTTKFYNGRWIIVPPANSEKSDRLEITMRIRIEADRERKPHDAY